MRHQSQVLSSGTTLMIPDRRLFLTWTHFISLYKEQIPFCHCQKLPKGDLNWECFTCLLRGIDHTNVISKLEGTQHGSEDSENQGPGDLWGMRHRAGKHEARSATHLLSRYSLDFWQVPQAGSHSLILTVSPMLPAGSFKQNVRVIHGFLYTADVEKSWE